MTNLLHGMRIVPHPLAVQYIKKLVRHPLKKRRRNWRWVREEQPGCLRIGDTLFIHPDLIARLRNTAADPHAH